MQLVLLQLLFSPFLPLTLSLQGARWSEVNKLCSDSVLYKWRCVCIYGTRGALVESGAFQHSRFCVSEDVRLGAAVQVCSHQTQHLKHLISQK